MDNSVTNINVTAKPGLDLEPESGTKCSNKSSYEPIKTFQALISYAEPEAGIRINGNDGDSENNTDSLLTLPLPEVGTNVPCPEKTVPFNKNFGDTKVTLDGKHVKASNCPKTMVCHDFKGGYLDDK